jgi:copper(I)-binding protein
MSAVKPLLALGLALFALPAMASTVKVDHPWVRATAPGQEVAGAYMDLTADADMTLVAAESKAARKVELHTMSMEGGVMVMRPVESIALPKGKTVSLKPGGLHVMLIGLNGQIKEGDKTAITLLVKDTGGKTLKLRVEAPAMAGGQPMSHDHMEMDMDHGHMDMKHDHMHMD